MENALLAKIEKLLYAIDFSQGHKQIVWERILSRLQSKDALSDGELDDVAGGHHHGQDISNNWENLWKK